MKLNGFTKEQIAQWAQRHLHAACIVVSDGLGCFSWGKGGKGDRGKGDILVFAVLPETPARPSTFF